ncbi:Arc family DNA-binding protein [Arsukibacterium indicum]|uniref:Arc family DNA-binding protein n=1 Tax=Arsukibacterium indicum TaxID=2848612 RepID=A0ABS6MH75_9GAMM|nr:Arc family DNA-binding protein [Arsukibacterium indicum]MBV2128144.1 Arc family DNA-binding protein [Arsukibacterium indicum]
MSREDPKINIRVPLWLKDKLHQSAGASGRSVNSEIALRLQASFMGDVGMEILPSAEFAEFLSNQARVNDFNSAVMTIIEDSIAPALKKAIFRGEREFSVDIDPMVQHFYKNFEFAPIDLVNEVIDTLRKAGYSAEADSTEIIGKF